MAWVSRMSAVKKAVLCGSMLLLGNSANSLRADTASFDRYAIPQDKRILELCRQAALMALPGKIQSFQIHNTAGGFHYRFDIETPDSALWTVVCESTTQKIITIQRQE